MGVNDAESMREADERRKAGVEARNTAESFIGTVEKQMSDMSDKISTADKENLTEKIRILRDALAGEDTDKVSEAKKELEQASWKVSQQAYQGGGASSSNEGESNSNSSSDSSNS